MTKILALGDVHGNKQFVEDFYTLVTPEIKPDLIFQVGDTTLSWHQVVVEAFLDHVATQVQATGIPFYFIDGNHEDFYTLFEKYMVEYDGDFVKLRDGVFYCPRGHTWEWDGVRFMGFGGAFSVNRSSLTKYVNWFPEEIPSYTDICRALDAGKVDVLFTHDVMAGPKRITGIYSQSRPSPESDEIREVLANIAASCEPKVNIHGHHHTDYRELYPAPWGYVEILGLNADYTSAFYAECYTIIDTSKQIGPDLCYQSG